MKRFITVLTAIIATAAIVLAVMPTTFAFEPTDNYINFLEENNYDRIMFEATKGTIDYDGGTVIFNIVPDDDENIEIIGKIYSKKTKEMVPGIPIKYVLPDGTTFYDVTSQYGEYGNFKLEAWPNGEKYSTGLTQRITATNISSVLFLNDNGKNGYEYETAGLSDEYKSFEEDFFRNALNNSIDNWHYDPKSKSIGYFGPENPDAILANAKGTFYEDLIAKWVNKVRQEKEDYAYWQEMQDGDTVIPTVDTSVVKTGKFTDVTTAHWANANIEKIADLGYFSGYEDGTFRPDNQITHEEFIKVIVDFGLNGTDNAPANPASANWAEWAQPYLNTALNAGVVTADDTDLLAVNTPITRGEMAKVIGRLKEYYNGVNTVTTDISNKIADWNAIPDEYKNYVADAYDEGILAGYEDGTFKSDKSLTRAEASSVIIKLIDNNEPTTPVVTATENINTVIEPTANVYAIAIEYITFKDIQPVLLNGECMVPITELDKDRYVSAVYSKSTNTVRLDKNIYMPVSPDGTPNEAWVGDGDNKTYFHAEVPAQVINDTIMIPFGLFCEMHGGTTISNISGNKMYYWYTD